MNKTLIAVILTAFGFILGEKFGLSIRSSEQPAKIHRTRIPIDLVLDIHSPTEFAPPQPLNASGPQPAPSALPDWNP